MVQHPSFIKLSTIYKERCSSDKGRYLRVCPKAVAGLVVKMPTQSWETHPPYLLPVQRDSATVCGTIYRNRDDALRIRPGIQQRHFGFLCHLSAPVSKIPHLLAEPFSPFCLSLKKKKKIKLKTPASSEASATSEFTTPL